MTEFELRQQELLDRRRTGMRDAQSYQAPRAQMVGGHYVPPSFGDALVQGLRAYAGQKEYENAGQELKNLQSERSQLMAGEMKALTDALRGRPAEQLPEGVQGPTAPAVAGGMDAYYQRALQSQVPEFQQMGMQGQMEQAKAMQAQAQRQQQMQAVANMTPQQAIAQGIDPALVKAYHEGRNIGRDKVEFKDIGGQFVPVTEFGDSPAGVNALQKTGNPFSDLVVRGPDGQMIANAPLVGAKGRVAAAGAPRVSVDARNFNTQESEQSKAYGKQMGEVRANINQAGYNAPGKLANLDRMEQLLEGIDGGKAAPAMAEISSLANSFGIKLDPKLGNKQAAEALAREMAASFREAGTGPMTDKDFDNFLKRVPDLSKSAEGRREITGTMRAAIERDKMAAKYARDYAKANNGVIDDNFFDAIADFYAKNPVVTPKLPSKNARGQSMNTQIFNDADAILGGGM